MLKHLRDFRECVKREKRAEEAIVNPFISKQKKTGASSIQAQAGGTELSPAPPCVPSEALLMAWRKAL